jgi:hypothetical protein
MIVSVIIGVFVCLSIDAEDRGGSFIFGKSAPPSPQHRWSDGMVEGRAHRHQDVQLNNWHIAVGKSILACIENQLAGLD